MKKIILIVVLLFLVTGCADVKYNLNIDKELRVVENINISATKEYFDNYYMNLPITVVKEYFNNEEWMAPLKNNNYQYELRKDNTPFPSVFAKKSFNSLNEYIENTVCKGQVFNNLEIFEDKNLITISAKDYIEQYPDDSDGEVSGNYVVTKLNVNIKIPFVVTNSNASSINKRTNTYTWVIDEKTKDKEIKLTFDKNRIYIYNISWYISLIIIILLVIVGVLYVKKFINKNKLNNGV